MEVCWIVAPRALAKRGQREVAGEFSEPASEGTVFESANWSLSSSLRGCLENTEESHVCLDKGIEESGVSLVRSPCWRAFLKDEFIFKVQALVFVAIQGVAGRIAGEPRKK